MTERARVPTMHDVAREAGVSTATVSRVVNGARVRPATARTVREAMHRLGYVPNQVARGLVTGRSDVVGVLVPDLVGPLNAAVARGVEDALEARGMHAVVVTDHREPERERARLRMLVARRVDGLVLIGSQLPDAEIRDAVGDTPVVLVGAEHERTELPEVRVDNRAGIDAALRIVARPRPPRRRAPRRPAPRRA
ncbi:MAG: LacI family DNA-binding transcriptional regulator [Trueperaceae bacterium]|nr:LacI family DNA-binding transcriptional regulator [Trueperaceae bacterium]